jgi:hypothetical protein
MPVVVLGLFGSLEIAGGLFFLAGMAYVSWTGRKLTNLSPPGYVTEDLFAGLCVLLFGCCLMAAARLCWKGRWRAAVSAVVFVIAGLAAVDAWL